MKKSWRKIVVDSVDYAWCLPGDNAYMENYIIVHANGASNNQTLHLDTVPWGVEIRPRTVKEAILYALKNGWEPFKKGFDYYLGYENNAFIVLPNDKRRN